MKNSNKLSPKQHEILTFIKKYIVKNNYSPSIREIASGVNLNSPATVHVHIQNLITKGYLKRSNNNHKLLELMVPNEFELKEGDAIKVPYLDQFVISTNYEKDLAETKEYFYLSTQMIPNGSEVFMMKVQDDSMCNIGIYENDIVIVEKNAKIKNGDVVAAIAEESELVIRSFYQDEHYIRLQPENDLLPPTVLLEATILGKIVSLYRKF